MQKRDDINSIILPQELSGKPVADALWRRVSDGYECLAQRGVSPTLAIVRTGDKPDDAAYFRAIKRAFEPRGLRVIMYEYPADIDEWRLSAELYALSRNSDVHGILPLLPFPGKADANALLQNIIPQKDVDGVTALSQAWVYSGTGTGFAPCAAAAVMELIRYYKIPLDGTDVTVMGRSRVIGKPLSMLLMRQNATVTICHSHSDPQSLAHSPLCVFATGCIGAGSAVELNHRPVLLDCGINTDADGRICGDLTPAQQARARAYSPVPGGVGAVTVAVLAKQLVRACDPELAGD